MNSAGLETMFFEGLVKGLRSVLGDRSFRVVLTKAITHPIDSAQTSFRRAGYQAGELILKYYAGINPAQGD